MKNTKSILNFLMIYFIVVSVFSVSSFMIEVDSFRIKMYWVSAIIIISIIVTYVLGVKYQQLKLAEIEEIKRKKVKKVVKSVEKRDEQSWGQIINSARHKDENI